MARDKLPFLHPRASLVVLIVALRSSKGGKKSKEGKQVLLVVGQVAQGDYGGLSKLPFVGRGDPGKASHNGFHEG